MWIVFFILIFSISFAETERIIVKPKSDIAIKTLYYGYKVKKKLKKSKIIVIEVDKKRYREIMKELNKREDIEYAVKDYKVKAQVTCPPPSEQWWNSMISISTAKGLCTTFSPVVVAVVDTGVAYDHSDFNGRMWRNEDEICSNGMDDDKNGFVDDCIGYDFVDDDSDPYDNNGHGTHIAGIIGAVEDPDDEVSGINPGAKIMAIRVLDNNGVGYVSDLIEGIYYAVDNGAKVINLSLGAPLEFRCEDIDKLLAPLREAFIYAKERGVLIVSASGNENFNLDNKLYIPASIKTDNHIVVGAVKSSGDRADYSNFGMRTVDVGAPGGMPSNSSSATEICSTIPGNSYGYMSGTSIATPFVSGIASLIYSCNGETDYRKVKGRIILSAWDNRSPSLSRIFMTEGTVNAFDALNMPERPVIFHVEPNKASPGGYLRISGVNFGSSGNVYINNIPASEIRTWTDTLVEVRIPPSLSVDSANPFVDIEVEDSSFNKSNAYKIELIEGNILPEVRLCADKLSGPAPLEVTIKAFASDPDGQVVEYIWNIPKSVVYKKDTQKEKVLIFREAGTYAIEVTVKDNKGATAKDKIGITVTYGSGSSSGGGPCFIATSVYGEDSLFVNILREFRDRILNKFYLGRKFTEIYYRTSPPIAEYLKDHKFLSNIVAIILLPLVFISWIVLKGFYILLIMSCFAIFILYRLKNVKNQN